MENKKRRLRCEDCNELKNDVVKRIDPYQEDINNSEVTRPLCDECTAELLQDI